MTGKGRSYREKRLKTVVAPSEDVFVIKKPGARIFSRQFKDSKVTATEPEDLEYALSDEGIEEAAKEALDSQSAEELVSSMDQLLYDCVVDPKIVPDETDDDDELWIVDVETGDYFFLIREITEFAGVTPEKLRELFRDLGGACGSSGGNDSEASVPEA